ncbi:MAG: DUF262 domain-containing HNH endonuclease family protein [Oscillospiraceae bacterium]|jgi:hypothetical protein|nr:DUF262 domain-containing HNH endonuclease family protein [Oscillospiraceae bacterium]
MDHSGTCTVRQWCGGVSPALRVPSFQRGYVWGAAGAEAFYRDLRDTCLTGGEHYLGIVLLSSSPGSAPDLIDGQQRLITLAFLLAALRECAGLPRDQIPLPSLQLKPQHQTFFLHCLTGGVFSDGEGEGVPPLSEVQQSMEDACHRLLALLHADFASPAERTSFAAWLLSRVCLTFAQLHPFRDPIGAFLRLNGDGDGLHALKVQVLLRSRPGKAREAAARFWDTVSDRLGSEFSELLRMILAIKAPDELREEPAAACRRLLEKLSGDVFAEMVLAPYARVYEILLARREIPAPEPQQSRLRELFWWLNQLPTRDWMTPALYFLAALLYTSDRADLLAFFQRLERLAAFLYLTGAAPADAQARFSALLRALKSGGIAEQAAAEATELLENEAARFAAVLDGPLLSTLDSAQVRYVLLRLESFAAGGLSRRFMAPDGLPGFADELPSLVPTLSGIVVAQVFPAPADGWPQWTAEDSSRWSGRAANLVPLLGGDWDPALPFAAKKDRYLATRLGPEEFTLTAQVLRQCGWTPALAAERQEMLCGVLRRGWRI